MAQGVALALNILAAVVMCGMFLYASFQRFIDLEGVIIFSGLLTFFMINIYGLATCTELRHRLFKNNE